MYSKKGTSLQASGKTVQWNLKQWHQLLSKNSGDTLYIDIFIERLLNPFCSYKIPWPFDTLLHLLWSDHK